MELNFMNLWADQLYIFKVPKDKHNEFFEKYGYYTNEDDVDAWDYIVKHSQGNYLNENTFKKVK